LDVHGGDIRIATGGQGITFPDGTRQTTAMSGGGAAVPAYQRVCSNWAGGWAPPCTPPPCLSGFVSHGVDCVNTYAGGNLWTAMCFRLCGR
jgi:hypothetical protein